MTSKLETFIFLALCSCATARSPVEADSSPKDGVCNRDADCTIIRRDLINCCDHCPVEPYAVSKAELSRKCHHTLCNPVGRECPNRASPNEFVAVCVQHTCERRSRD